MICAKNTITATLFDEIDVHVAFVASPFKEEVPVGLEEVPGDVRSYRVVADAGDDAQHVLLTYAVLILSQRPLQVSGRNSDENSCTTKTKKLPDHSASLQLLLMYG